MIDPRTSSLPCMYWGCMHDAVADTWGGGEEVKTRSVTCHNSIQQCDHGNQMVGQSRHHLFLLYRTWILSWHQHCTQRHPRIRRTPAPPPDFFPLSSLIIIHPIPLGSSPPPVHHQPFVTSPSLWSRPCTSLFPICTPSLPPITPIFLSSCVH